MEDKPKKQLSAEQNSLLHFAQQAQIGGMSSPQRAPTIVPKKTEDPKP